MNVTDEFKKIENKVKCEYLRTGILIAAGHREQEPFQNGMLTIECWNNQCGPKIGCDFYEGKLCKYRSLEINDKLLYKPNF